MLLKPISTFHQSCEGQAIKTTDDLLHAICDVKKDGLVDPSTDSCEVPPGSGHSDDPASAEDAPLLERHSSSTLRGSQRTYGGSLLVANALWPCDLTPTHMR